MLSGFIIRFQSLKTFFLINLLDSKIFDIPNIFRETIFSQKFILSIKDEIIIII